ncbi:MAG: hypothetical protein IPN38_08370 [Flavobacteriales bacterium]|nr:hypothetical protein [Flavobacteriales bacterium]
MATTRTLVLAQCCTNPLLCGFNTYSVRVRASFDGGAAGALTVLPARWASPTTLAAPSASAPAFAGGDDRVFFDGDGTSALLP